MNDKVDPSVPPGEESVLTADSMESLGEPGKADEEIESVEKKPLSESDMFKKKLGMQEKRHSRELRELKGHIQSLTDHISNNANAGNSNVPDNSYGQNPDINNIVTRAVNEALSHKERLEHESKQAELARHVHKKYQALEDHLNRASDKYDDFDEVVRRDDLPITAHIRDASLMIDNPAEVLYKLAKNPDELSRISKLHPLDQAREVVKLSVALMNEDKRHESPKTLSQLKSMPVSNTSQISDKTSIGDLRRRMKSGWK